MVGQGWHRERKKRRTDRRTLRTDNVAPVYNNQGLYTRRPYAYGTILAGASINAEPSMQSLIVQRSGHMVLLRKAG
jgi:hypothetical protein